ncbi:glutamine-hydrolyzing carbamoyl-phosphate synthase small subunit [Candidatus Providencia siddallii]|uniref:Carbamoyl phosphate synthase small chain n=1 Tax=Candidatus Providencia siddallii TaxID=1715285 RepID=A0ABP1CDY6_9GAMM
MNKLATLILEDGTEFHGYSIGIEGITIGEIVFNTSMTGYQEIITDPSYSNQIITFTYPHIGNVGVNNNDEESQKIHIKGLIIRDLSITYNKLRGKESLNKYLKRHKIIAISDIDTRKLTRLLRNKGTQNGCIFTGKKQKKKIILEKINFFSKSKNVNLSQNIGTNKIYNYKKCFLPLKNNKLSTNKKKLLHVVTYDFGVKKNILHMLINRGCNITLVPSITSTEKVLSMNPDGIFLSNGPGDPSLCINVIKEIKKFLKKNIPIFGICLGHQLLALANGANTVKMKFGHHGANHPVKDLDNDTIIITSQNHNFIVDELTLPKTLRITHKSLFDGTLQGIHHINKPFFSFQGHPEASPGPHDANKLFDHFINLINNYKQKHIISKCK